MQELIAFVTEKRSENDDNPLLYRMLLSVVFLEWFVYPSLHRRQWSKRKDAVFHLDEVTILARTAYLAVSEVDENPGDFSKGSVEAKTHQMSLLVWHILHTQVPYRES